MATTVFHYPIQIEPLPEEDGGGFAAYVTDLPGCMSDGETHEQAIQNVRDAVAEWLEEAAALGREIPRLRQPPAQGQRP